MTAPRTATVAQLRAIVREVEARVSARKAHFIGVRALPEWSGPSDISLDGGRSARVVPCPSPLAFAKALVDFADLESPVVLLSEREGLPEESCARLAKRRLHPLDNWALVLSLFGARNLDPRLRDDPWIAEALLNAVPEGGYPQVATGVLDEDTAWRQLLERRLSLETSRPAVEDLVNWAASSQGAGRFAAEPGNYRAGIIDRIEETAGPTGLAMLRLAEKGDGADILPLGLVLDVLHHEETSDAERTVAARFEGSRIPGGPRFDASAARAWAEATTACVRRPPEGVGPKRALQWLDRAEVLLREAGAGDEAYRSDFLRIGYTQRLERFATRALTAIDEPVEIGELNRLVDSVDEHAQSRQNEPLLHALRMAVKMIAWLHARSAPDRAATLQDAVERYAREGGFLDRCRRVIAEHVEDPSVGRALARLLAVADEWRERENERFGSLLATGGADWKSTAGVVPIERVIPEVLAPLAEEHPVLLLVMDGMGMDVFRELLESLATDEWVEWSSARLPGRRRVLAAFPTVTNVCRASLFAGEVAEGGAARERKSFAAHPALSRTCRPRHLPRLFHKGDLLPGIEDEDTAYLESIRTPTEQVVAVVLNAVDDHLGSGGQFRHEWTQSTIRRLGPVLAAAREAKRVVVLTADHGHVLGRTTAKVGGDELGERYRVVETPRAGEILLRGPRVRAATGNTVVLPWSERIRYASLKHGYHGGASLQEVVVPLAVLRASEQVTDDSEVLPTEEPAWWTPGLTRAPASEVVATVEAVETPVQPMGQGALFETHAHWLDRCLATKRYRENLKRAGRRVPAEDRIRLILATVEAQGGQTTRKALSSAVGIADVRLRGILPVLQRVLNVEGYLVLAVDEQSDTVRLDRALLERQFNEE